MQGQALDARTVQRSATCLDPALGDRHCDYFYHMVHRPCRKRTWTVVSVSVSVGVGVVGDKGSGATSG